MDDIIIKYEQCTIWIWRKANLTDMPISKFKKLLKLAKDGFNNNPVEIKCTMLEMLDCERSDLKIELGRTDAFAPNATRVENRLKKIEKYRGIVEQWDI